MSRLPHSFRFATRAEARPFWRVAFLSAIAVSSCAMADTPLLSLAEAVRLAERQAPAIDAQQAALEASLQAIVPAGQLPDPELVAGIDNLPITTGDAFDLTRDAMTMRKIGLMQTFTRREKREGRVRLAQAEAERQRALLTDEKLSVREATAKAWIARWSAERRLALLESLRPQARAQIAAASAALVAGRGSAADALAAKSAAAQLEDRIDQARQEADATRAGLARWLPEAVDRALGEPAQWSDLGIDPHTIVEHADRHRELLAFDAMEGAADAEVDLARAEKRPDWSVELAFAQRGPRYANMVSVEVRVPLPLFPGSRQNPGIASKLAAADRISAEREDAVRARKAELRTTLAEWRSALEREKRFQRELLPLAADREHAALAAYRGGRGDLRAALDAFDDAINQRIAYTRLLDALGNAWATLHFAFPRES